MAKIAIDRAPPTALPRRYLFSAGAWGVVAGVILLIDGEAALQTRWAPSTLAVVHALTLGLLGNAMFGSLLQFLPAAAGVQVRGGTRAATLLHVLLNLGAMLLVAGFRAMQPHGLLAGGGVLALAFAQLAAMTLPGILRAHGPRLLRAGIGGAIVAALVTVAFGVAMLLGLTGRGGLAPVAWADAHAGWGVLGWMLGLISAVGAVVMPMFQGTRELPWRMQLAWMAMLATVLLTGTAAMASGFGGSVLHLGAAICLALFALAGLWLQWRAPRSRNVWLVRCWRAGFAALLGGAFVLAIDGPAILCGALVLGIALPWLVAGMQMEIIAFLGWIELHRRCGRGVRLPSVQALLTERHKAGVFFAQALAAWALLLASTWPTPLGARVAGFALACSQALLCWRVLGVGQHVRRFVAEQGARIAVAKESHAG